MGEIRGLTGDTAMERGTGEEEIGMKPVGVVLPLLGCNKLEGGGDNCPLLIPAY